MKKAQLYVKGLRADWRTTVLDVDPDDTVCSFLAQIEDVTGIPAILYRIETSCKRFYYDTPGTLADNELVDPVILIPNHVTVTQCYRGWDGLQRKTLRSLGFNADGGLHGESPIALWRDYYLAQKTTMFITVTDYIRMDGGERQMHLLVAAEDTVGSLMGRVQRRRRYPVAMQQLRVRDARTDMETRMDNLDATLADYNVKKDSLIELYMDMEFAVQQQANKEIAAAPAGEEHKPADDEE